MTTAHRAILDAVANRYRAAARGESAFARYLRGRGFEEPHWHGLGFAPPDGIGLTGATDERIKLLRQLGILGQRDGRRYERLRNGIVFTVTDPKGAVRGFVCRRISGEPKYLNTHFPKSLLPLGLAEAIDDIRRKGDVLLVEGPFDWLAMRAMGHRPVLALLGSSLSDGLAALFKTIGLKRARLCFDADAQGQAGQRRAQSTLRHHGIATCIDTILGRHHDPASLWACRSAEKRARCFRYEAH